MIVFIVWVFCYCREKRSTMAEIVEQVQEREAAHVSQRANSIRWNTYFSLYLGIKFFSFFCSLRQEESLIGLLAASQPP